MREGKIEGPSKRYARERGWWVRKFKSPSQRSVPDDIFAKGGVKFAVEFKATGVPPSGLQEEEHRLMRAAGWDVFVVDSKEQFKLLLELMEPCDT